MTESEIQAFLTIVRSGSLSAAARELYITQPALSRRIQALEDELGFKLIVRSKGIRTASLTEEGKKFMPVAEKWQYLWDETRKVSDPKQKQVLHLSAVGSVITYVLPKVLEAVIKEDRYKLDVRNYHSVESFSRVESGFADMAFVTDLIYSEALAAIPAYSEPFVLATKKDYGKNVKIHPSILKKENEIMTPWSQEYELWHNRWFSTAVFPSVNVDQLTLVPYFLNEDRWIILPWSMAEHIKADKDVKFYELEEGPEDRLIYYLVKKGKKSSAVEHLLEHLKEYLEGQKMMKGYL